MWNWCIWIGLMMGIIGGTMAAFENIKFRDCKSSFTVDRVAIDGARVEMENGRQIQVFKGNSQPKMQITFTPNVDVSTGLSTSVNAKIEDVLLKWTLPDPNTCNFMSCPLKSGTQAIYEQSFNLKEEYPKGKTIQVNWVLQRNGEKTKDVCVIFLARIQP